MDDYFDDDNDDDNNDDNFEDDDDDDSEVEGEGEDDDDDNFDIDDNDDNFYIDDNEDFDKDNNFDDDDFKDDNDIDDNDKNNEDSIDHNIFVSAEKFAEMLEEKSKTKGKHGGSNVFRSSDGTSAKQIDWEVKRHQKLKGSLNRKKRKPSNHSTVQSSNNKRAKRYKR